MSNCKHCGKKFGFFEKVYANEDGSTYCEICVKEGYAKKEENISGCVTLNDGISSTVSTTTSVNNNSHLNISDNDKVEWEFRVIKLSLDTNEQRRSITIEKIENVINRMGNEGWELVSVLPLNVLLVRKDGLEQPAMIFKRKKDTMRISY